jgi:putative DNA methylase
MTSSPRLIEDYLPIEAISKEASREKSVRKGHISTLHLWWARRPLVACRAAVYGALVPATQFQPENGPENKRQSLGRANAAKFVERLCKYPGDPKVIKEAEEHILIAHAERLSEERGEKVTLGDILEGRAPRPKVLDMFAGGGAIPLEALRLGCEAYALDLNPVAHIIELCTLVYPQKYGKPDPNAKGMTGPNGTWGGLAEEVRYWGEWVLKRVKAEIGDLYPPIPDPNAPKTRVEFGADQVELAEKGFESKQGSLSDPPPFTGGQGGVGFLTPVAYLWTRTVTCKNPACGATVPLVRQTWLCKKEKRYAALKMIAPKGEKRVRFEVVEAGTEKGLGFDPAGFSKAGNATCPFCGTVADSGHVKVEGCAGRMGQQMMAIACTRPKAKGKIYLSADDYPQFIPDDAAIQKRIEELCMRTGLTVPNEEIVTDAKNANFTYLYGLKRFSDLFSPRQLLCLLSFAASIRKATEEFKRLGIIGSHDLAVVTLLSGILDRLADFNSSLCIFNYTGGRGVVHTFGRQALPMTWDFAETDPFNPDGASWVSGIADVPLAFSDADMVLSGEVRRGSATNVPWAEGTFDAILTDPPYYDNVPYADIADYFYVWLKRTVGDLYPEHFGTDGTPKKAEAVADATRHGGDRNAAKRAYESMMSQSFLEAYRTLKSGGQMVVVYAHKTTLGWSTLVDALRGSNFTVTEAWPLDTEKVGRLRDQDSSALASSIFLVARKREGARTGSYEREVRPQLEEIVRERVETLWEMGISGADLVIAAVGAGLKAYTQFARVEKANGDEMPAEGFLAEVEGVVLNFLLKKIFKGSHTNVETMDGAARFYVLWRYAYGNADLDAGEAIVMSFGQPVELDGPRGLSTGTHALLEKKKGTYHMRDFTERGADEHLGLPDGSTPSPLMDILHRVLWLVENQPRDLKSFLDQAQPNVEHLRLVAQALAGPALKGNVESTDALITTTSAEQSALGKLLANWRGLVETGLFSGAVDKPGQSELL